ncbi:MAG TPA: hypothetical protein EYM39_10140 [Candidatus Latescibacteria bacterium]|nr:hypothetical protein [Candidatus Latescibacterota bacterium]
MTDREIDILDLLAALNAGKKLIIWGTLSICILTGLVGQLIEDEYEATVQLLPPKEQKEGFGFADLLAEMPIPSLRLGEKGTPADIFVAILKSPTMRRQLVEDFNLMDRYEAELTIDAIETLERKTEIGKSEEGTIMISVLDRDPVMAADIANRYVALLDSTNRYLSRDTALDRQEFIHLLEQRENVKLDSVMRFLQVFQEEHNAIAIEEQARAVIRASSDMQMAAMELAIEKLSLLRSGFAPSHPEVVRLEQEILARQEALALLRDGVDESTAISDGTRSLGASLKENLFLPLRKIPQVAQEYTNIAKDVIVQQALMKMLLEQKAEAFIEASNTTSTVQVLDAAVVPEVPARPRRLLMVFVAGVLSSFACIFYTLAAVYVRSLSQRWQAQYAGGGSAPSGSGP